MAAIRAVAVLVIVGLTGTVGLAIPVPPRPPVPAVPKPPVPAVPKPPTPPGVNPGASPGQKNPQGNRNNNRNRNRNNNNNNNNKAGSPLETAVKNLEGAEDDVEDKLFPAGYQKAHQASLIIQNEEKVAKAVKPMPDKDKVDALEAILKDIKEAEKNLNARKADEATKSLQAALSALNGMLGKKKK